MSTSIILGMGVPTTANYIITSTIAAPALIALGVIPIAAYAGAAIACDNPFMTGSLVKKPRWTWRTLLVGGELCLIDPGLLTDIIGIVILIAIAGHQAIARKNIAETLGASAEWRTK